MTIPDNQSSFFKIIIRHFNDSTLDYIGQSLPMLPFVEIHLLTLDPTPMKFYLRPGGTIYINATNSTSPISFMYMIKDTRLGYPVAEYFNQPLENYTIYVPRERNYSVMIFPLDAPPLTKDVTHAEFTSPDYRVNVSFNTSMIFRRVTGYALYNGSANFTNLSIITYLLEPGNMVAQNHPFPANLSAELGGSDLYDPTNGSFNISLPGTMTNLSMLLFATAYNATSNTYYGGFRNISLNYSSAPVTNFNFTLLLGNPVNVTLEDAGCGECTINVTTARLPFQLKNSTGANISAFAHVEIKVSYPNVSTFSWMEDVEQSDNGSFAIPALSGYGLSKINVFTQNYAPLKTKKTASQLSSQPVLINLTHFDPGAINESEAPQIFIDMLKSTPECDTPYPPEGCSLMPSELNESQFDPFKIVLGGGKISLRMRSNNNITVHYKNVDMLASGPPDAMFDTNSNQSQSGATLEEAWRFGSKGPEIYDEVLIGIPLNSSANANNVSVKIWKLYDDDWNEIWNASMDLSQIPSDYNDFNTTWFITGMKCSTGNQNADCYVNTTDKVVWVKIPHFSGIGPQISSETVGNVTVTLSPNSSVVGSVVNMNFTVKDTLNATSWYNITFPSGFDASGAIINIRINGNPTDWTNTTSINYVNISSNDPANASASSNTIQYINLSNITVPSTPGNYTVNITTNNSVTALLNYTVVAAGAPNITSFAPTSPVYNNVSEQRTFNISVNQTVNVTWYINGTMVQMNTSVIQANYTNTSAVAGTWIVNATVNNTNGTDAIEWVWIVTDNAPPVINFQLPTPQNGSEINVSYINVSVSLSEPGTAILNWNGVNELGTGTFFYKNKTGLLSGNYTFKVFANDTSGNLNSTETRIIRVNRSTLHHITQYINIINATVTTQITLTAPDTNITINIPAGTVAKNVSNRALTNIIRWLM